MSEASTVFNASPIEQPLRRVQTMASPSLKPADAAQANHQKALSGTKEAEDKLQEHTKSVKPTPLYRSQSASEVPTPNWAPLAPDVPESSDPTHNTLFLVGTGLRIFHVPTNLLTAKSPYFVNLAKLNDGTSHPVVDLGVHHHPVSNPLAGPLSYPELDEFAMALFTRWLHNENALHGPHDFQSLHHYLSLYILARKFEVEQLQNQVMDLVRHYYRAESMTAPAFRLSYIYANTSGPNMMRTFLVATAAYRVLSKGHDKSSDVDEALKEGTVSDGMKDALRGGGDLAVDFVLKLVEISKNDMEDPRRGKDSDWHQHSEGPFGTTESAQADDPEPYEKR